jgi:hypothetical protein
MKQRTLEWELALKQQEQEVDGLEKEVKAT